MSVNSGCLEVLKKHHAESFGWALACCRWRRNEAEDVLQEAYLKVLDGRAKYDRRAKVRTWFFAVIRYTAAEAAKKRQRRNILNLTTFKADADAPPEPDDVITRSDESRQLMNALMQLPLRQREVLHLVFYHDMTLAEAAESLVISLSSARTHYHRGKQRLGEILNVELKNADCRSR